MTRFLGTLFRRVCCLLVLAPMLAGCAHVHFAEGAASLDGQALVFGRLVLVRDGETGTLGTFGTAVMITSMEAIDEPRQVTEPFDASGRFYWRLAPGRYLLEIGLNPRAEAHRDRPAGHRLSVFRRKELLCCLRTADRRSRV